MSRSKNVIKNTCYGMAGKTLTMLVSFATRTVFIRFLGNTYLGVSGLYSEILSVLSFAELGFGSALTFAMYKPVADNDSTKVKQLLDYYKKVYCIIAGIIAVLGISLLPALPYIIRGADWISLRELRIYYLLYLFNTVISYFVTYKLSYLNALQKNYIATNVNTVTTLVTHMIQIVGIVLTRNFLVYLLTNTVILFVSRVCLSKYLNSSFPLLKEKTAEKLPVDEKRPIYSDVKGLIIHQFASIAVHSTDNILISMLTKAGVYAVGLISNYTLLINSVLGFVQIIFNSITSAFGNIAATDTTEKYYRSFRNMNFLNFWIYGFCSIAFWILVPPFITLWIGKDNLIDQYSFALILVNVYLQGQSTVFNNVRIAKGNFQLDSKWALMQALVNLVVSIICAQKYGLVGIYIGTVASRLVFVFCRPLSMFEFLFQVSPKEYYSNFFKYLFTVLFAGIVTSLASRLFMQQITLSSFALGCLSVLVIPNACFYVLYAQTEEFKSWCMFLKKIVKR